MKTIEEETTHYYRRKYDTRHYPHGVPLNEDDLEDDQAREDEIWNAAIRTAAHHYRRTAAPFSQAMFDSLLALMRYIP